MAKGIPQRVKIKLAASGSSVLVDDIDITNLVMSVAVTRDSRGLTEATLTLVGVELDAEADNPVLSIIPMRRKAS